MKVDLSPITPTTESTLECHLKSELPGPGLVDSPTGYIMTIDNTSYVTVEGARYAGDFSTYLRDREKPDYTTQDPLYTLSQRFDSPAISYELQRSGNDEEQSDVRVQRADSNDQCESNEPKNYQPMRVCVYLMSKVALHLDLEDGNCSAQDLVHAILQEKALALPRACVNIFTLWMCSGLVELQLKPHHKPFELRLGWRELAKRFSNASDSRQRRDEPSLSFQRNVFFSRKVEKKIKHQIVVRELTKVEHQLRLRDVTIENHDIDFWDLTYQWDQKIIDLLYEEARYNILEGRYPCEANHHLTLGGIQARIEMGPYNPQIHTLKFFRENLARFLPAYFRRNPWSWLRLSGKDSPEWRLLEQYKMIPTTTPNKILSLKYLEFCRALPFYGGAFFHGQVEQPVRGLTSLITHQDIPVVVAINEQGVYIIDHIQTMMLLGLKYEDMSWEYARPSQEDNPDCLPCLFIQFMVLENGTRVSKILQVFSKQAVMMDALISVFVEQRKRKVAEEVDNPTAEEEEEAPSPFNLSCLYNRLSKLTLATFDDDGHCIGTMGSWSFSY